VSVEFETAFAAVTALHDMLPVSIYQFCHPSCLGAAFDVRVDDYAR